MSGDTSATICTPAPRLSRVIAGFVDYLVASALFFLAHQLTPHPDYDFVMSLVLAGLYFSLCDSWLTQGRTLGKRAFSLRVVSLRSKKIPYLSPKHAAIRFFWYIGVLILCTELPTLFYRSQVLIAEPYLLELHMLFVLSYAIVNLCFILAHPKKRALHDILSYSAVVRTRETNITIDDLESFRSVKDSKPGRLFVATVLGLLIASALWSAGLFHPQELQELHSIRFVMESSLKIRFVGAQRTSQGTVIQLFLPPENITDQRALAKDFWGLLQERDALLLQKADTLIIQFFSKSGDWLAVSIDTKTGEIKPEENT